MSGKKVGKLGTVGFVRNSRTRGVAKREIDAFGSSFRVRFSPLAMERAKGCTIWDVDGNEYLDFSAGGTVANTGYSHPAVVKAATDELQKLTHALTPLFPNPPALELAEILTQIVPGRFHKKVWMGASGSDAAETVYDFLPAATKRKRIITFFGSHHGLTVGANFLSGHKVSSRYLQSPIVTKVPYPYCYRCPFKKGDGCCNYCVDFIEREVFPNVCPADDTAAIMVEPIEGLAGELIPPDDFLPQLREICDEHGIMLVDDEVKTGMGRTGKMFAIEHTRAIADVTIVGKPLASGLPLSAVVGRDQAMDSEAFSHLASAAGHPVCCAAGVATVDVIKKEKLVRNSERLGRYMKKRFEELMGKHPLIGDVRGRGLFIGVELVKDRKTKEPAPNEARLVTYRAWQNGLVFIIDGTYGNNIEISPPLTITRAQLDAGLQIFEDAIRDVEKGNVPRAALKEETWT